MSMKRIVGLLLATSLGCAGLSLAVLPATPASAAQFETYEWNMSGWIHQDDPGSCCPAVQADSGLGHRANAYQAKAKIDAHNPLIVFFDEICSNQFNYLDDVLAPRGYVSIIYVARWNLDPNNCTWYGNVVFAKGAYFGTLVQYQFVNGQTHSSNEFKGMGCRRIYLLGGNYVPCALHTWSEDSIAIPESHEAYGKVNELYAGSARLVGGDFNFRYDSHHSSDMADWYSAYNEGDDGGSSPNEYTHITDHKIDYQFANGGSYNRVSGTVVTSDGWSDHLHYYATFDG